MTEDNAKKQRLKATDSGPEDRPGEKNYFNVVLLQPQIPQNTGNIARTCAATGCHLHLVRPMGFTVDDAKLKRAGLDYWHLLNITYYDSTEDFFKKTTGGRYWFYTTKGRQLYSSAAYHSGDYLVFGREDKGIDEALLYKNLKQCVRLPMRRNESARSLNLSNTVAIGVYEALRQNNFFNLEVAGQLTNYQW